MSDYALPVLSAEDQEKLKRVYEDLLDLTMSEVPSVAAASRSALALVATALSGQGLHYELYSKRWS